MLQTGAPRGATLYRGQDVGFGGDAGELFVCCLLFSERGVEQRYIFLVVHQLRPAAQRAVYGDLVMLHLLPCGDERGIENGGIVLGVLDSVLRLGDESGNDLAGLRSCGACPSVSLRWLRKAFANSGVLDFSIMVGSALVISRSMSRAFLR
jgi:hypothetical protein